MNNDNVNDIRQEVGEGTLKSYILGFLFSILLTVGAYFIVVNQLLTGFLMVVSVMGLGVLQMIVQLFFFLHLGKESKPRWNLGVLLFMALVIAIIVGGSLWIMNNLDYNVMPSMNSEGM